ncbi:DUF1963 domain-containing protein [Nodosilinea sp. LEGE 06152]|uniref:YwqG family protein n=1 Tax=Nodosilinea sp. LEGE 06152 TaxID=2777966 RepID=UPI00188139CC|nr:DUF1963 domain-containing protein [Nodosilinea sp. LEGE 06152]MBE9160552.1 DUF1963 domain-containing protein [Nodosilinea sp. LEGE 06152]
MTIELPPELEQFRSRIEKTVKPCVDIHTQLTRDTTLWQSKFLGLPYLPKSFEYPKDPEGNYLYLLAQINFEELPSMENFPEKGILQFYISDQGEHFGCDFDDQTSQMGFRVLYFSEPVLDLERLVTNFDFLPVVWEREDVPFCMDPSYIPHKDDCFALEFQRSFRPITTTDYQCEDYLGKNFLELLSQNDDLWQEYHDSFEAGHRLGGYPDFTQDDPRQFLPQEQEPYILLLQIYHDLNANKKIQIEWGDIGICNFFIQESFLKRLDFSNVMYNWDCG